MKTSDRNNGMQSIKELWESIADLSQHIVQDNRLSDEYPVEVRSHQMLSLKALIAEIDNHHYEG